MANLDLQDSLNTQITDLQMYADLLMHLHTMTDFDENTFCQMGTKLRDIAESLMHISDDLEEIRQPA